MAQSKGFKAACGAPQRGLFAVSTASMALLAFLPMPATALDSGRDSSNPLGLAVNHIALGVASIDVEKRFYHDVLGFEIDDFTVRPKFNRQHISIPGFRIDLIEQKGSERPTPTMGTDKQGWLHPVFKVANAGIVYRALQAKGIPVAPGRMDGTEIGSFTVTDPEGNQVELAQPEPATSGADHQTQTTVR